MSPNVVLLDIETSPLTGYAWTMWDTNILHVLEPSKIISVAWKQLESDEVNCKSIADYTGYKKGVIDDLKLVKEVWSVLDKADVVIAHHGDSFDIKKLNARFVFHGLNAPSAYKTVDTKKVASKYFRFDSNSLKVLGDYLGVGKKLETGGFELWMKCIAGDPVAWEKMKEYNVGDVILLENVYLALRPFMENHPNMSLIEGSFDGLKCPTCSSINVTKRGFSITKTGHKQRYQCNDCGSWSSGPFAKVKSPLLSTVK